MSEGDATDGITIEPAIPDDRLDVLRVLDAAMLETDADTVAERIDAGDVLVARSDRTDAVIGALVAVRPGFDLHVDAVAVRRARRGRGVGSALVGAAIDRAREDPEADRVTAEFDASLAGLYTELGFDARPDPDADRLHGTCPVGDPS